MNQLTDIGFRLLLMLFALGEARAVPATHEPPAYVQVADRDDLDRAR